LSAMQTGGSGAQASSFGAAGRRQIRVFVCPLFGNRRNEDGSTGKTGLFDCLILKVSGVGVQVSGVRI